MRLTPLALIIALAACSDPPQDQLSREAGMQHQILVDAGDTPDRGTTPRPRRDARIPDAYLPILDWGLPPDIGGRPPVEDAAVEPPEDASIEPRPDEGVEPRLDEGIAPPVDAAIEPPEDAEIIEEDAYVEPPLESCGFTYHLEFVENPDLMPATLNPVMPPRPRPAPAGASIPQPIAHAEPPPPYTWTLRLGDEKTVDASELTMPGYSDNMPMFDRGVAWSTPDRCYETPRGAEMWTEAEAFSMYRRVAEHTTGIRLNDSPERRTVIGLRGAYPGTFDWHGNTPNYFNDTIVLMWQDAEGPHVREFPVNTDTGSHDFGEDSSSSLRPNMRYHMITNWHRSYNALRNNRFSYRVWDDDNANGHWDSDRNLWLPPHNEEDHSRQGSAHNIHMGAVNPPLGRATVDNWSAGCQVIPGMANWTEFITHAWTVDDAEIDYFLVDVRDIPRSVWWRCDPDGSHDCPYPIPSLPFEVTGDTRQAPEDNFDVYNCSEADESGGEIAYVLYVDREDRIRVEVDCDEPVDIDIHLLDGDNPNACLARGHMEFTYDISPGRYLIIADTWADEGQEFAGPYTLRVSWD